MSVQQQVIVSWQDLDDLVARLADMLAVEPQPDVVLAISRGGLVPTGMLSYRMGWRDILVAGVAFYDEAGQMDELQFLQFPDDVLLRGKRVLIVDEVWDSGTTIAAVVERVIAGGGRPITAVLHYKPGRSRVSIAPDHHVVETDDWVVYPFKAGR
jgi:hypoxanthine phosphoribosyltransferase